MNIVTYYVNDPNAPKTTRPAHLGVNILVICNNRLLMERRWDCERWGLPGGGAKRGETLRRSAVRELYEETGLRLLPSDLTSLKFYEDSRIAAYADGSIWRMYVKLFALHLNEEPILRISREATELRFFTAEELKTLDIVEPHRDMVTDYLEWLNPDAKATAFTYLQQDEVLHIDMLEPLRRGHGKLLFAGRHGVLMLEQHNHVYMLSADSPEVTQKLLPMMEQPGLIVVHHDYERTLAARRFSMQAESPCYQVIYPKDDTPIWGDVRPLGPEYQQEVQERYRMHLEPEEVRQHLLRGEMIGQFVDGKLAAFIGTHREGAIGMLEVYPAYRRKGIGQNLIHYMARFWQQKGYTAFAQIVFDNERSLHLQAKLGAKRSASMLYWIW